MKCPYCAEEIQDDAIVCRFCFASRSSGKWQAPGRVDNTAATNSPRFTMRTAAVFFIFSAMAEIVSISTAVPLFGQLHSGMLALLYHLLYIALYLGVGIGLWAALPWGFQAVLGATVFYTLDKAQYLLSGQAASTIISEYGSFLGAEGQNMVTWASTLTVGVTVLGWWGFLIYLYFKRDYFLAGKS